jgi:phage terminase small subunit
MNDLNPRQDAFVREYLTSFNATQAVIKAGYSEKTAAVTGAKLLRNAKVAKKIDEAMAKLRERFEHDSNIAYAKLWQQLDEVDKKIEKHNQAMQEIDDIQKSLIDMQPAIDEANSKVAEIEGQMREAKKHDNQALLMELKEKMDEALKEQKPVSLKRSNANKEIDRLTKFLIKPAAWEKIETMRMNILHDILDRGGYRPTDKVEITGAQSVKIVNDLND